MTSQTIVAHFAAPDLEGEAEATEKNGVMFNEGQPQVLVVGRESRAIPFVRVLLSSMKCNCLIARDNDEALTFIRGKSFDAVLIDVRCAEVEAVRIIDGITEARPGLASRVLVITDRDTDSDVLEPIKQRGVRWLDGNLVVEALWSFIGPWLGPARSEPPDNLEARLVFDSWHRPPEAGVRNSYSSGRHLIYESSGLVIHLWAEPGPASNWIKLTGQIQDSAEPPRKFENLPVSMASGKNTLWNTKSNQFGEFDLEVGIEEDLTLSLAIRNGKPLTITLPREGWKH